VGEEWEGEVVAEEREAGEEPAAAWGAKHFDGY
jgi:hypothetical protein